MIQFMVYIILQDNSNSNNMNEFNNANSNMNMNMILPAGRALNSTADFLNSTADFQNKMADMLRKKAQSENGTLALLRPMLRQCSKRAICKTATQQGGGRFSMYSKIVRYGHMLLL